MRNKLNPKEAPPGYFAELKSHAKPSDGGNICRACDWRGDCSGEKYRCMPHELANGLKRSDGCDVVFKRLPKNDLFEFL
jgi:hypothetical protein